MGTVDDEELLSHELRENKPQALDDFVRLGRYCVLVLVMAEIVGLNCIGSMTYMIYAGSIVLMYVKKTMVRCESEDEIMWRN